MPRLCIGDAGKDGMCHCVRPDLHQSGIGHLAQFIPSTGGILCRWSLGYAYAHRCGDGLDGEVSVLGPHLIQFYEKTIDLVGSKAPRMVGVFAQPMNLVSPDPLLATNERTDYEECGRNLELSQQREQILITVASTVIDGQCNCVALKRFPRL